MYFKQVILEKGGRTEVCWIPEVYAHQGMTLSVNDDDGWFVKTVYQRRMSEEHVEENSRDFKYQRQASDI